jgi:phosphomannomutase
MNEKIKVELRQILNYQPVTAKFGTSGVRALVADLTDLEVYSLTLGALHYFKESNKLNANHAAAKELKIPVACDLRSSSPRLVKATAKAIIDAGYQVDFQGKIPTPALTFYALQQGVASYIVTGSHIPADRNGQKANRCDGEVLKTDEQGIVAQVNKVRTELLAQAADLSAFDQSGMLKEAFSAGLPIENSTAIDLYKARYSSVFSDSGLQGKRLLFFQYSAVGRDLIVEILRRCGAEVIAAGRSEEFVPIDTEAISDQHLQMLKALVVENRTKYGHIDALISTDGDSDRPLLVAVEEIENEQKQHPEIKLRFIPGDLLGLVVADYLQADSVSVPISTNPAVHEFFRKKGIITTKTRIGSPFVIAAMQQALASGFKRVVSWEANGGFLMGSDMTVHGNLLKALPTRDAVLPILCALYAAADKDVKLTEIFSQVPQWFGKAGLIDNFPQQASQQILCALKPIDAKIISTEFLEDRVVSKNVEGEILHEWFLHDQRAEDALAKKELLETVFSTQYGFADIIGINTQDGIRCFFSNDDIAHIRPSGNAPQLRIYAHARSQARADEIVAMALQEPDGLLRKLQKQV